jgi:surface protein
MKKIILAQGTINNNGLGSDCSKTPPTWTLYKSGLMQISGGYIDINWLNLDAYRLSETSQAWHAHIRAIKEIEITGDLVTGRSLAGFFAHLKKLETISGLERINTSKLTNMQSIFYGTNNLTSVDVSSWDTKNVNNVSLIFYGANNLKSIDLSSWNTDNVIYINYMFGKTSSLTDIDISNWNTSKVENMEGMFWNASNLTNIDVSNWNTGNVTNMDRMFCNASKLTNIDVSNWNTGNVTNMCGMFYDTIRLTSLNLSNWDTRNVKYMDGMFSRTKCLNEITFGHNFVTIDDNSIVPVRKINGGYWFNTKTNEKLKSVHLWEYLKTTRIYNETWKWNIHPVET